MRFNLKVLGSGITAPFGSRLPAGYLVTADTTRILLECNPITVGARLFVHPQFDITSISGILITHAHNDHSGGETAFLEAFRTQHKILDKQLPPFTLCGPSEKYFRKYLAERLSWHWPELDEKDHFWTIPDTNRFQLDDVCITVFPINHAAEMPTVGYRIQFGSKSLVYCGDFGTTQFQKANTLDQWISNADLLVLDCGAPTESPTHLTIEQGHIIKQRSLARRLLATHIPAHHVENCLLYTSPSPRDLSTSRMPSSA